MGINIYQNAAATGTSKARALQNGSPKWLPNGEARACYAMLSYNTSSTAGGVVFYDKHFQQVRAMSGNPGSSGNANSLGNYHYAAGGDAQAYNGIFYSAGATQAPPASSATANSMNATNSAGEFGNLMVDVFSNSTVSSQTSRNTNWTNKQSLNSQNVDSDHADRSIVYLLIGSAFRAVSRIDGDASYDYFGTQSFTIPGVAGSMWGSASYNAVRKELVVLSYAAAGGNYTLITFQGIDLDRYPSPATAFADSAVVRTDKAIAFPSWSGTDGESVYSVKPCLADDGSVFTTVFVPGLGLRIFKTIRGADLSIASTTLLASKTVTTTYGRDNGAGYGQRRIQSRDGGAVMCFAQYYYYGAGMVSLVIDKRKSTWLSTIMLESADTSSGYIPVPYGDSGFASYYCGNAYASSFTGGYITGCVERAGATGALQQTGANFHLPYFPGPNTTNYPGFTQVTDYSMLDNQAFY